MSKILIKVPTKPYIKKFVWCKYPHVIQLNYSDQHSAFIFSLAHIPGNSKALESDTKGYTDTFTVEVEKSVAFNKGINVLSFEAIKAWNSRYDAELTAHCSETSNTLKEIFNIDKKITIKNILNHYGIKEEELSLDTMIKRVFRYEQKLKELNASTQHHI